MKKILLALAIISNILLTKAQELANCAPPSSSAILFVSDKIYATLGNGGELLYSDLTGSRPSYNVFNYGKENATIFNSTLWLGGLDESSEDLKLAAMTYRQSGNDFWAGPIDDNSKTTDSLQCDNYNKHWSIGNLTIEKFKQGEELGEIEHTLLYNWPGKSNPNLDFNHLNQSMAPFVDVDGDEIYNPDNGDYPLIKGDKAVWWVINDVGNEHTEFGGKAFGLEIQKMFYSWDKERSLEYSSFFDVSITNKSNNNYKDFIFGHRVDFDLGNYIDDYVGCDTANAFAYVYNGDAYDGSSYGFGENAPLQSCQFVKVPGEYYNNQNDMLGFIYYNNDFTNNGNPENSKHIHNYLTGKWKDGSIMTNGGAATDSTSTPTRYIYIPEIHPIVILGLNAVLGMNLLIGKR